MADATRTARIDALMAEHGIAISARFIPWSQSRNRYRKRLSLNWSITLSKHGAKVLTTDYSEGIERCPASRMPGLGLRNLVMRDEAVRKECETGITHGAVDSDDPDNRKGYELRVLGEPILPDTCSVLLYLFLSHRAPTLLAENDVLRSRIYEMEIMITQAVGAANGSLVQAKEGEPAFMPLLRAALGAKGGE